MKNTMKIAGILLMLIMAGSLSLNAQRGMRGMRPDSAGMNRMKMQQRQMPMRMQNPDSMRTGGMRYGMAPGRMNNMRGWAMNPGMRYGMAPGRMNYMGHWGMNPGMRMMGPGMRRPEMGMRHQAPERIIENIPGLTDKQKKDIADLRQKQQDEMQKFREEMQGKMQEMRESQRTKVMDLLTPEQKKWFEENTPKPLAK